MTDFILVTHGIPAQLTGLMVEISPGKRLRRMRFPTITDIGDVDFIP